MFNFILIIAILMITGVLIFNTIKKKQNAEVEGKVDVNEKTYSIEKMIAFVKRRLDEITKVNLYDIGLSEAELERRKNKKYELKKALKGCTYGDVNDKKYVKTLIYDLLLQEYGVNEINISKVIPFDLPSLLTPQDKFDILIYTYQKEFGYEALTQMIKKYNLATLKYLQGEAKPSYVITKEEINEAFKAHQNEVLKYTEDPIVSCDVVGKKFGATVDGLCTNVVENDDKQLVKVVAWYDNEWGYTAQMLRTAKRMF